jgi:hypothetical protein
MINDVLAMTSDQQKAKGCHSQEQHSERKKTQSLSS